MVLSISRGPEIRAGDDPLTDGRLTGAGVATFSLSLSSIFIRERAGSLARDLQLVCKIFSDWRPF